MTAIASPVPARTAAAGVGRRVLMRVRLHGVVAEVQAPREPFAHLLGLLLGAYPQVRPDEVADVRVEVTPDEAAGGWAVASGQLRLGGIASAGWAARRAEWLLADHFLRRLGRFVHVHAAVVASDHRSLLVVGSSGRGKSTTAAALAQAGLTLYADDVALICPDDLRPVAFPRPIKLNAASRAMLRVHGLRVPDRVRIGESIARSALPGLPAIEEPGPPIRSALFLAPERATLPSLRPLSAAEALLRAVQRSSTERIAAGGPTAGVLALVNAVPSYELTLGNPDDTVALLLGFAADAERPATVRDGEAGG